MPNDESYVIKAKKFLKTKRGTAIKNNAIKKAIKSGKHTGIYSPNEVAEEFVSILKDEINAMADVSVPDGGLGSSAIRALSNISISEPVLLSNGDYSIDISFDGDMYRPSLDPSKYGGINDISALLNNGYEAKISVYGKWHGEDRWSLRKRSGAHFIGNTVSRFKANRDKYNIKDIIVDSKYEL